MASNTGAALFPAGFHPVPRRIYASTAGKCKPIGSISPVAVSAKLTTPPLEEVEQSGRGLRDYFEQAKEMMMSSTGGPPRWFSPLECAPAPALRSCSAPLLLYLPGADGVGLGLIMHHENLAKMFDVWCLDIPLMDRTPFTELVKLVEVTVRSEHNGSPNRPIYLVGESLGGCLALAVAACNPDIDLMLVLANPATSFNQSLLQPLISLLEVMPTDLAHLSHPYVLSIMTEFGHDPTMPSLLACNIWEKAVATMRKGFTLQQTVGELSQDLAAISSYLSVWIGTFPKETLLWKLKMLKVAAAFANSRLHAVNAQTLILSSGRDQLLPSQVECERLLNALPKCEIRRFTDSGHFLFLDSGVDLVTVIKGASFYRRSKRLDYVSDYMPPTPSELKKLLESTRWLYSAISPVMLSTLEDGKIVKGLAGIPSEGPVLLVGYHSLLGLELVPLLLQSLIERNIMVRGIAHPLIYTKVRDEFFPDVSTFDMFRVMGAVPVSAKNLFKLLSSKSHVLLYPGGMREGLHRKGEEYKLFWPEQSEFVRMAAKFGATIVPFGVVGEDDIGQVVVDYDDFVKIPACEARIEKLTNEAVKLRDKATGEVAEQFVHMPVILPKVPVGRYYYYFGKPIETQGRETELRDRERCDELYVQVKSEVEQCLAYLKERRGSDPYRNILARVVYQVTHGFESEIPTFQLNQSK